MTNTIKRIQKSLFQNKNNKKKTKRNNFKITFDNLKKGNL